MTPNLRHLGWRLLMAAVFGTAACSGVARAQDDDEQPADNANARQANAVAALLAQQTANFAQLDQWVFGRFGGSGGARNKLDSSLLLRIEDLERVCDLTDDQKKKLRVAGRGDIKRFFDKVEELKRKFQQNQNDPNVSIWQAIQPFQAEINTGLFGHDSIYVKTIRRTLTVEQSARYESLARERRLVQYRATVEWFVVDLDKGLGLTDDQRQRFVELLATEVRPPRRFGQGDYWYLMLQASRVPESKMKAIFDAPQWRLLSRQFGQARGMEPMLRSNGVIPDDEPAGAKAAVDGARAVHLLPTAAIAKEAQPAQPVGTTTIRD